MPKPVCIPCGLFFKPHRTGARLVEMMPAVKDAHSGVSHSSEWQPYKVWMCDLLRCDGCGKVIAVGYGSLPTSERHHDNFDAEIVGATKWNGRLVAVYDC